MGLRMFSSIPVEKMDEAYVARLRRYRVLLWILSSLAFATILGVELQSRFQANVVYLFALAFIMLTVLFTADLISGRIDIYESEQVWRKKEEVKK